MILKLLFILSSYIILSMLCVDSYVLFAANIDDFRSLANKIIPGQLADQLADIAVKQDNSKTRHNTNKGAIEDPRESSNESTEDSNYSDSFYKAANPLTKDKERSSKKKYMLKENIDLDELAKIVKEKLEKDYKVTPDVKYAANKPRPLESNGKEGKIEDYYYKDENFNGGFNKDAEYEETEKKTKLDFTTKQNKYGITQQYDAQNINFKEKNPNEATDYAGENVDTEYVDENVDYNQVPVKQQVHHIATVEKHVRDGENGQKVKEIDEYGVNTAKYLSHDVKKAKSNAPDYYDVNLDLAKEVKIVNPEETNAQKDTKDNVKQLPEYYEDNVKDTQIEPAGGNGDIFKEIDMLKPSNDSYEDYVTPKRDNIFDSDEHTTKKAARPILAVETIENKNAPLVIEHSRPKAYVESLKKAKTPDVVIKPPDKKISAITPQPEFIRAKTASMWYQNPNIENYDDATKKIKVNIDKITTKRRLTMVPTKGHVKISSPNYFAKLPVVAEKYDFNEPIPEKDREPEVIKHIGNPPSMINKKVKI